MTVPFPQPTTPAGSRTEVFLRYLGYFRDQLASTLRQLPDSELRRSILPSGWTPLELLRHLTYVERRWLEWGFEGHAIGDPWGDQRDGRWYVPPHETLDDLLAAYAEQAARNDAIIESHELTEVGQPGERWSGAEPATLERVLFHLLQEYARHMGHLDIVAELDGAGTGELLQRQQPGGQQRVHAPRHVHNLRHPQVHAGGRHRQRLRPRGPVQRRQPRHHGVERGPHGLVQVGAEPERDPPGGRLRVHRCQRPAGGQVHDGPGRHRALDRRAADLAVALRPVPVAQVEQRARHGDRQVQRRARHEFLAVDVPARLGARRDRRVLPGRGGRGTRHAEERRDRPGVRPVGRGRPRVRGDLPQEPRRVR